MARERERLFDIQRRESRIRSKQGVLELAASTRRSLLGGNWGVACAYALFGFFTLTMLPLELTTPDLLSGTAMFGALGALLRLRAGSEHEVRHAIIFGASLGFGALAKSFMVPWAVVCMATLFAITGARRLRVFMIAGVVWAAIVAPWTVTLTRAAGRFTFGDTGRLTYAWYVNGQDVPSLGGVPPGARTARTDAILAGVGATGPAPGTDPMWFDPVRWNAVKPHWNASDQLGTLKKLQAFYVQSLTPLLFLVLLIATAPRGTRQGAWSQGWVVHVPAVAGIVAYALVLVTARYVMPFVLASTLMILATIPRSRRMLPLLAALGIVIPIGLESVSPETIIGLTLVASIVTGMAFGAQMTTRWPLVWGIVVILGALAVRVLLPPSAPDIARVGAVLIAILFWFSARAAIRDGHSNRFATRSLAALALLITAVFALRFEIRMKQDLAALSHAKSETLGNVPVKIAEDLAAHGVAAGTRIALIGPHAESYWARSGRLNIVANVPRTQAAAFWRLTPDRREALLSEFAAAGAAVAIASMGPDAAQPDSGWTRLKYNGWVRVLRNEPVATAERPGRP